MRITQAELAKATCLPLTTIHRYESGFYEPSISNGITIANFLKFNLNEVKTYSGKTLAEKKNERRRRHALLLKQKAAQIEESIV